MRKHVYFGFTHFLERVARLKHDFDGHFVKNFTFALRVFADVHERLHTADLSVYVRPLVDGRGNLLNRPPVNENLFPRL